MPKSKMRPNQTRNSKLNEMFVRADKEWSRGKLRSALRLFLAAAKKGDKASQLNAGYFYDNGIGTRRNRTAALYWYGRAYRRGDANAANNIGTIWRDEHNPRRALSWFLRAVKIGDVGSNLEIGKHYLRNERDPSRAIAYLNKVCQSDRVSEHEVAQAQRLLEEARRKLKHV